MKSFRIFSLALTLALLASAARAQTPFGNAIVLNGTNQYVVVTNFGHIIPTNEVTVEFWANTAVVTGQSAFILNPDSNGNRFNAHINYGSPPSPGVIFWDFGNIAGGRLGPNNSPANSPSNWVHYAFVASKSGNFMSVYTNGVLLVTQSGMTPFVRGTYDLDIGGGSNYFSYHGSLDDFRVWNTALSQAQIQANLRVPLTGSETNLVVYYRFDNSSGKIATNSATATGALYNGVIAGGAPLVASGVSASPLLGTVVTTAADTGPGSLRQALTNVLPSATITFTNTLSGKTILLSGALSVTQSLTIDASSLPGGIILDGNQAGAVFQADSGNIVLTALTITNGSGGTLGGGGVNANGGADLTLNQCTLVGNTTAQFGGAINSNAKSLTMTDCTLSGNSAGDGGAIINSGGPLTLTHCTLTLNQSTYPVAGSAGGGGIDSYNNNPVILTNCIIAGNTDASGTAPDFWIENGTLVASHCLIGDGAGSTLNNGVNGNQVGNSAAPISPLLAPLGNYGGTTLTMPPLPGSPAVDNGVTTTLAMDQRGLPRVAGFASDIGAVEAGDPIPSANYTVVTSASDFLTGVTNTGVTLRSAVTFAPSGSHITFAPALAGQTIALKDSQITLANLTVDGSGLTSGVTLSGNNLSRIFNITNGVTTLTALTLANGGGGGEGGALQNAGTTTINQCTFIANFAGSGGAIWNASGVLTVNECTFSGNTIQPAGGGSGIRNEASLFLNGCTLTANGEGFGGGFGGALWNLTDAQATLNNTIMAGNSPSDIVNQGTLTLTGSNIIQDLEGFSIASGPSPITAAPQLAPLGNYGGLTLTAPPLPGSPAIDAGSDAQANSVLDQRGFPRLSGAHVDIGAVEAQIGLASQPVLKNLARPNANTMQFTFTNATRADFTVLTTTNVASPVTNWTVLGEVTQTTPGQYQFTDTQATNTTRFYQVVSP